MRRAPEAPDTVIVWSDRPPRNRLSALHCAAEERSVPRYWAEACLRRTSLRRTSRRQTYDAGTAKSALARTFTPPRFTDTFTLRGELIPAAVA